MEIFLGVLVSLLLIGISNIMNRFVPFISVPIFQILLGAAVAILPLGIDLALNPELFLVLFIAPLLFNDGKRIPREELWNLRISILRLALGLVFTTVVVGGVIIHWLIPSIPMPAAFALAAILSPTDAVAVGALSSRIHMPKSIMRLLEGEALMNDASGLVAFKFAVAATVTGVFSLTQAALNFTVIALGGLIVGAVVSALLIGFRVFLRRFGMEDVTMHMLIQIVTPFVIYLVAEELGMSGILAVVAGGIVHAIARDRSESSMVKLQIVSNSTWSVIIYILNGLVFVLLGLQLPDVLSVIIRDDTVSNVQVLFYIIIISMSLLLLRFVWIFSFWRVTNTRAAKKLEERRSMRDIVITTLSGVRGAVTLAAAFSIPFVLQDGSPFPERDLILFLAAGVILFTLLAASFLLPLLSKGKNEELEGERSSSKHEARIAIMQAAMRTVEEDINDENKTASYAVLADYNKLIQRLLQNGSEYKESPLFNEKEANIRILALAAERKEVQKLLENGEISEETSNLLHSMIDQMEIALSSRLRLKLYQIGFLLRRLILGMLAPFRTLKTATVPEQEIAVLKRTKLRTSQAAIAAVRQQIRDDNAPACQSVITSYTDIIDKLTIGVRQVSMDKNFRQLKKEIRLKAIQAERNEVQAQFETGVISRETANQLRKSIHYSEATMLEAMELS